MSNEDAADIPNTNQHDDGWDRGWEEHRRRQLIRMSKLTLVQKVQWLEDMQILNEKLAEWKAVAKPAAGRK